MTAERSLTEAEKLAEARLGGIALRREQMAVVANIYRAASAVRQHLENSVLREADLTWTAFVVLWVVWIWGESETRHVAEEAGMHIVLEQFFLIRDLQVRQAGSSVTEHSHNTTKTSD